MPLYVYSITAKDHPLRLDGVSGVGAEPSPLRAVTAGTLCAVVSDIAEDIRPKRRDLNAHQQVLEMLMADGVILPLQFGYIATDDLVVRQVLESNAESYLGALKRLEGCAEYHVRASQADEAPLLQQILQDVPEASDLNNRIRGGDRDPGLPLALGEIVAREVQVRQEALAAGLTEALVPFSREYVAHPPSGSDFLNLSLLVPEEQQEALRTAEANLAREIGSGIDLRFSGPLPPYSFVQ
ncbi:GvpL/GvpF family gas vesicle protein [Streptomyces sp. A1547]|uniref:GvpL/GvpF family gas vesicle protein n=1 Tax=Streptomyces sp. A1547 TaxID=2563105 RepID=UPI00061FB94C|nr:GvpL/GvpF family gas vesicle protein [Streptomyces sp. A1547]KJY33019.1 gas vesicle protein [Streptomyces sp. NRRL S-444]THA31864.1 GvpL/GvpF family gas vesicle protein [Streptomyces sp. A1547]